MNNQQASKSPTQLIDARIKEIDDWRGEMLGQLRTLVRDADPEVVKEWMWRGVPVWSHDGIVCTGETYKSVVKMTFARGAALPDHLACSIPVSKAIRGAPSIFTKAKRSTRERSRLLFARLWT